MKIARQKAPYNCQTSSITITCQSFRTSRCSACLEW